MPLSVLAATRRVGDKRSASGSNRAPRGDGAGLVQSWPPITNHGIRRKLRTQTRSRAEKGRVRGGYCPEGRKQELKGVRFVGGKGTLPAPPDPVPSSGKGSALAEPERLKPPSPLSSSFLVSLVRT
eukprot:1185353-Prorocentrum_minimum.AAC.5